MADRPLSLWHDTLPDGDDLTPRAPLPGDRETDVAIVGAGFTGLWTALYLRRLDPALRVTLVEAEVAGFGASGRNGGWCSALLPMGLSSMAGSAGRDAAIAMQQAMFATVDEVGRAAAEEGIDCHYAKGGYLHLATNPAHTGRLREELEEARRFGLGEDDLRWLDRAEAADRLRAAGVLGALYTPHCAAIHPARLARGLATAVERHGAVLHEGTRATAIEPGRVRTDRGTLKADVVVRATEGYTPTLDGQRRTLVPLYSLMIATEPLPDATWDEIGLRHRETFNDARHLIIYGQRTADGRFAFGGRGAPYHFGSAVKPEFDHDARHAPGHRPDAAQPVPGHRRRGRDPRVGRPARRRPGLDVLRGVGPGAGPGLGGRLRRRRRGHHQPGRPDAGRPHHRQGHRSHPAALGRPPVTPLGARAPALAGHPDRPAPAGRRRPRRDPHRPAGPAPGVGHRPADGALTGRAGRPERALRHAPAPPPASLLAVRPGTDRSPRT